MPFNAKKYFEVRNNVKNRLKQMQLQAFYLDRK